MTRNDETEKILVTVPEAAKLLSLGLTKTWGLIYQGRLPVVKIDRAVRVHMDDVRKFAENSRSTTPKGA